MLRDVLLYKIKRKKQVLQNNVNTQLVHTMLKSHTKKKTIRLFVTNNCYKNKLQLVHIQDDESSRSTHVRDYVHTFALLQLKYQYTDSA